VRQGFESKDGFIFSPQDCLNLASNYHCLNLAKNSDRQTRRFQQIDTDNYEFIIL